MASRAETAQRRAALREHVEDGIRTGVYPPGGSLPSLRELGARFELSRDTVQTVLHELVDARVLTSAPRRGVYVSEVVSADTDACFVMLTQPWEPRGGPAWLHGELIRHGFERRVAQRGGVSLYWDTPERPLPDVAVAGIFGFGAAAVELLAGRDDLPVAWYSWRVPDNGSIDRIWFDNLGGGRDATRHLLDRGYRQIGFLARHPSSDTRDTRWARDREDGWRLAMQRHNRNAALVCFKPTSEDYRRSRDPHRLSDAVAEQVIAERISIDALVAVDDWAIAGLLRAWQRHGLPGNEMPAMVGFENLPEARSPFVTSVQSPWDRVGEVAADLLWQRSVGQITGPGVERSIPMEIAARLGSRRGHRYDVLLAENGGISAVRDPAQLTQNEGHQ